MATADFARVEVAGVLRKKGLLAGRLTADEFTAAIRVIDDIGVTLHGTAVDRLERAAVLAAQKAWECMTPCSSSLPGNSNCLLTSDAKLSRAAKGTA